jgi:hypothetical protein
MLGVRLCLFDYYRYFDYVILSPDTNGEERFLIEAVLSLAK